MKINIRRAFKEDCPRLLELITELAVYEKAPDDVTVTLAHFEESGFALYYIRYSTWKGQAMYLEDIIVTESMRGKKIGKLLFDRLIEEAKEKKLHRIVWQVLEWNEPAINFYKKYNLSPNF